MPVPRRGSRYFREDSCNTRFDSPNCWATCPILRRRPGTIKAIVEYTGLDRHQVAALLKNEVKYIPLKALSRLCDYLIEHGHCTADQLPGALFAVEPENFWEMLARRRRLAMCLGVRRDIEVDSPDVSYVVASDSVLMGEILSGVTTLGGTAQLKRDEAGEDRSPIPHPEHLKQILVWSPGQINDSELIAQAEYSYREFSDASGDKALVCLGSTKSNPVVEIVMALAFGCDPFVSQDGVEKPTDRSCPVFFRYREFDPHPASCVGGLSLARGHEDLEPGIYYETAEGTWVPANSGKKSQHVAMVFYIHRESQGRLEMALGAFRVGPRDCWLGPWPPGPRIFGRRPTRVRELPWAFTWSNSPWEIPRNRTYCGRIWLPRPKSRRFRPRPSRVDWAPEHSLWRVGRPHWKQVFLQRTWIRPHGSALVSLLIQVSWVHVS